MAMKRDEAEFEARRTRILDMTARLFAERGCEDVSLSQIAGSLGRTNGIFLHMFTCKQDLLRAVIERQLNALLEAVGSAAEAEGSRPRERLEAMTIAYAEEAGETRDAQLIMRRDQCRLTQTYQASLQARLTWLETLFQDAIEAAIPPVRQDTAASLMLARALMGMLDAQAPVAWEDRFKEADRARIAVAMVLAPGVARALGCEAR